MLALLLLVAAVVAPLVLPRPARAQNDVQGLRTRVAELERELTALRNRVAALEEHLTAVVGPLPEAGTTVQLPVGDSPIRGAANGRATLVMFGDYQSDYTVRAHYVVQRLLETYPDDLRFVYKHYPLTQQHPFATNAALATIAAGRQGLYWELHDLLLANARRLDSALLATLAEQIGLELTRFDADRQSLWALERLDADEKLAAKVGVNGVPTLFLNGRRLETFRFDYVREQIDALLGR